LVIARPLNNAQAGQNMLAGVLYQLTRTPNAASGEQLLRDLESADAALIESRTQPPQLPSPPAGRRCTTPSGPFTNVARHSGASEVQVELSAPHDMLMLALEDNGRGLSRDDELHSPSIDMKCDPLSSAGVTLE
jgi:hypothetical protein